MLLNESETPGVFLCNTNDNWFLKFVKKYKSFKGASYNVIGRELNGLQYIQQYNLESILEACRSTQKCENQELNSAFSDSRFVIYFRAVAENIFTEKYFSQKIQKPGIHIIWME